MEASMSEKNDKDQGPKKKIKLSKEIIENLKDEDLDNVTGGVEEPPAPGPGSRPPPDAPEMN